MECLHGPGGASRVLNVGEISGCQVAQGIKIDMIYLII